MRCFSLRLSFRIFDKIRGSDRFSIFGDDVGYSHQPHITLLIACSWLLCALSLFLSLVVWPCLNTGSYLFTVQFVAGPQQSVKPNPIESTHTHNHQPILFHSESITLFRSSITFFAIHLSHFFIMCRHRPYPNSTLVHSRSCLPIRTSRCLDPFFRHLS